MRSGEGEKKRYRELKELDDWFTNNKPLSVNYLLCRGKFISFKTLTDVKSSEFYRIKATKLKHL